MTDPNDPVVKTLARGKVTSREPSRETILERQRMRRVTSLKPYAALAAIVIGFAPIAGEFWLYYTREHALNAWPILVGGAFMFVGAYMLNHAEAKDAVQFLVTNGIAIVGAIPGGIASAIRGGRKTDPPGTVVQTTITPAPPDTPDEK